MNSERRRWRPSPLRIVQRRRTVGRIMIVVAAVGLVIALVGTVAGWQLVGRLNDSTRSTLDVTIETIDSVESSIDVAERVLVATTDTIDTAGSTLNAIAESFDTATGVIDEVDRLTTTVGPALEDTATILRQLEGVGSGIDNVLRDLSRIPFGPDYDPERPLGETIGSLASEIEVLPAQFEQTSTDIDEFAVSLDELRTEVTTLAADVDAVNEELRESDELVEQYRANVADARSVAIDTRDGLDQDVTVMRILLVIAGINFAVAQIVPYWIGRSLLDEATPENGPSTDTEEETKPETENFQG